MTFATPSTSALIRSGSRIRTFLLLLLVCAATICPASWQTLSHSRYRDVAFAPEAAPTSPVTFAQTVASNAGDGLFNGDQLTATLAASGRQAALSNAGVALSISAARPASQTGTPHVWTNASASPFPRAEQVPPLLELGPAGLDDGPSFFRLPAARGLVRFALPPPSLNA